MKRFEAWTAVVVLAAMMAACVVFPRYEWRATDERRVWVRIDRWSGRATLQNFRDGHDLPVSTFRVSLEEISK